MVKPVTIRLGKNDKEIEYFLFNILKKDYAGLSPNQIAKAIVCDEMNENASVLVEIGYENLINYEASVSRFNLALDESYIDWISETATALNCKPSTLVKNIIRSRISIVDGNSYLINRAVMDRYRFSQLPKTSKILASKKPVKSNFEEVKEKSIGNERKSVIKANNELKRDIQENGNNKHYQNSNENKIIENRSNTSSSNDKIRNALLNMTMGGFSKT